MIPLTLLSALMVPAAPAPTPKYESFFPAKVGTKWVYQAGDEEVTLAVSAVDRKPGEIFISVVQVLKGGKTSPFNRLLLSEKGLFGLEARSTKFDAPVCRVHFPLKDGDKWDYNASGPAPLRRDTGTVTTIGFEKVVVPAGSYKAVRVETTAGPAGSTPAKTTFWYVPEVGLVQLEFPGGEWLLKSFTPAD